MKQKTPVRRLRESLRAAIDAACIARGEAQWTNGYRAAKYAGRVEDPRDPEAGRLYETEMHRFRLCGKAEARVEKLLAAYARAIRREGRPPNRRHSLVNYCSRESCI